MKHLIRLVPRWLRKPLRHEHRWTVIYTDDDECYCGDIRLWPSGEIVSPAEAARRDRQWLDR